MKGISTVAQRNVIVEEHLPCIVSVMRQNYGLIQAARMEWDDVYQQLAVRLIRAVDTFDSDKGKLEQHIYSQLKYELLSCKNPRRLYGLTNAPAELRRGTFVSFEAKFA